MAPIQVFRLYEAREVAKLVGITARRVMGWVEKGILTPSVPGHGKGSRRRFDLANVVQAAVLLRIQEAVGDRSPLPRTLSGDQFRSDAEELAKSLAGGWVTISAMLTIVHRESADPPWSFARLSLNTGALEDTELGALVRSQMVPGGAAVTFVGLTEMLTRLKERLQQSRP